MTHGARGNSIYDQNEKIRVCIIGTKALARYCEIWNINESNFSHLVLLSYRMLLGLREKKFNTCYGRNWTHP